MLGKCASGGEYNLLVSPNWPDSRLGVFQVKYHWKEKADLFLIRKSCIVLADWCAKHPDAYVSMNFPGIGNGKLDVTDVEPILDQFLPDTVTVFRRW